jgi:hypothetical protein
MNKVLHSPYIGWIIIIVLSLLWRQFGPGLPAETARTDEEIAAVFVQQRSDLMVEFNARVLRLLAKDEDGVPHQRFIVELDNGHTMLVAHNLDLAGEAPLEQWDAVKIRGEYTWGEQGGTVRWTHRDPGAGIKHGWIEHRGNRYE